MPAGLLDLAFVGLPITADGIADRVSSVEPLGVVVPSDHPLADSGPVDLGQFADDDFVSMPAAPGSILRETMVAAAVESGFRPRVVQEVPPARQPSGCRSRARDCRRLSESLTIRGSVAARSHQERPAFPGY